MGLPPSTGKKKFLCPDDGPGHPNSGLTKCGGGLWTWKPTKGVSCGEREGVGDGYGEGQKGKGEYFRSM